MLYQRALHEREVSIFRWKAVLPRVSHCVHFVSRLVHVTHFCATALRLFGEETQYGRLRRSLAAPHRLWSLHALWKSTARARGRPSSVQYRAPTCQLPCSLREPPCTCSVLVRHCAASLWGRGATRALAARARCAASAVVAPCPMEEPCTSEEAPCFGARPCSHMLAAACTS